MHTLSNIKEKKIFIFSEKRAEELKLIYNNNMRRRKKTVFCYTSRDKFIIFRLLKIRTILKRTKRRRFSNFPSMWKSSDLPQPTTTTLNSVLTKAACYAFVVLLRTFYDVSVYKAEPNRWIRDKKKLYTSISRMRKFSCFIKRRIYSPLTE